MKRNLIVIPSLVALLIGCSKPILQEGGLYYTPNEDGTFSVLKILKLDDNGVHVRLYSNKFPSPPKVIDESKLYMAGVDHKPNESLGMGHAPFSKTTFFNSRPVYIKSSTVKPDELEGYKMWLEGGGGYF